MGMLGIVHPRSMLGIVHPEYMRERYTLRYMQERYTLVYTHHGREYYPPWYTPPYLPTLGTPYLHVRCTGCQRSTVRGV